MKTNISRYIFCVGILGPSLFFGCVKDTKVSPTITAFAYQPNSLTCTIDSVPWQPDRDSAGNFLITAKYIYVASEPNNSELEIYGTSTINGKKSLLSIQIPGNIHPVGKYGAHSDFLNFYFEKDDGGIISHAYESVGEVGQLNVTTCDLDHKVYAGTFSFTAKSTFNNSDSVTVTNGKFYVHYQ